MKTILRGLAIFVLLFACSNVVVAQTTTTVADTIHGPSGTLLSGTITITNNATFTAADGTVVPKGTIATITVTNGAFSVGLIPNTGSNPTGSSYNAIYQLSGIYLTETWVVPTSPNPSNLLNVRTAAPPSPTVILSASQMPALTGDVTSNAGSTVTTTQKVNGVAYSSNPSIDTLPLITATNAATYTVLPSCTDTGGNHLNYSTSTHTFSCGNSGGGSGSQHQVNGTNLAANTPINLENSTATNGLTLTFSNPSAGNVQLGLSGTLSNSGLANSSVTFNGQSAALGASANIPFSVNGTNDLTLAGLNAVTSTANAVGLTVTPSNPAANNWKFEITGSSYTGNAGTATALATTPTQCTAGQFATGIVASGNANCGTPAGGTPGGSSGQIQYNNSGAFGGISQNAFASTQNVILVSPNCVTGQTNCFQVNDDGQMVTDAHWTTGSSAISSAEANFVANDVGKTVFGASQCTDADEISAKSWTATVASFVDAHDITVSISSFGANATSGCMVWGTPDDTGLSNADTAWINAPTCSALELPAGWMIMVEPHFFTQPTACKNGFGLTNGNGYGFYYGPRVFGQGSPTTLAIGSNFDIAACTHGSGQTCIGDIPGSQWDHFQIYGNSSTASSSTANVTFFEGTTQTWVNLVHMTGFGVNDTNMVGLVVNGSTQIQNSTIDAVGARSCQFNAAAGGNGMVCEDGSKTTGQSLVSSGTTLNCVRCYFYDSFQATAGSIAIEVGGRVYCHQCYVSDGGAANFTKGIYLVSNGLWFGVGDTISVRSNTTNAAVHINSTNAKFYETDGQILGGTAGSAVAITTPGAFFDGGGNTFQGAVQPPVYGSGSITGTAQAAANITPSTGWGTTGAAGNGVSAVAGASTRQQFTITAAGTPTANPTVAVTFPTAFLVAPICTSRQTGGTGAVNNITLGAPSTTAVTLTWTGTPAAASTYVIELECSN